MSERERHQQDVRDRLKNYESYEDFLKQYKNHREKHDARSHLYRTEGFEKLNEKYGLDHDIYERGDNMDDPINEKYNMYKARYYERYWDT